MEASIPFHFVLFYFIPFYLVYGYVCFSLFLEKRQTRINIESDEFRGKRSSDALNPQTDGQGTRTLHNVKGLARTFDWFAAGNRFRDSRYSLNSLLYDTLLSFLKI